VLHGIARNNYRQSLCFIKDVVQSAGDRGFAFESWFADELRRRGVSDAIALHNSSQPFDVVSESEGLRVQCKYSTAAGNTFDISPVRPLVGSTVRRYRQTDFEFFAVYLSHFDELYIFASSDVPCPKHRGMISARFSRITMQDHLDNWSAIFGGSRSTQIKQRRFSF
jgi:hypothetical protein